MIIHWYYKKRRQRPGEIQMRFPSHRRTFCISPCNLIDEKMTRYNKNRQNIEKCVKKALFNTIAQTFLSPLLFHYWFEWIYVRFLSYRQWQSRFYGLEERFSTFFQFVSSNLDAFKRRVPNYQRQHILLEEVVYNDIARFEFSVCRRLLKNVEFHCW